MRVQVTLTRTIAGAHTKIKSDVWVSSKHYTSWQDALVEAQHIGLISRVETTTPDRIFRITGSTATRRRQQAHNVRLKLFADSLHRSRFQQPIHPKVRFTWRDPQKEQMIPGEQVLA